VAKKKIFITDTHVANVISDRAECIGNLFKKITVSSSLKCLTKYIIEKGVTALNIMTLSRSTFSIMTMRIRDLYVTLSLKYTEHNNALYNAEFLLC